MFADDIVASRRLGFGSRQGLSGLKVRRGFTVRSGVTHVGLSKPCSPERCLVTEYESARPPTRFSSKINRLGGVSYLGINFGVNADGDTSI